MAGGGRFRRCVAAVGSVAVLTATWALASVGLAASAQAAAAPPVTPNAVVFNAGGLPRVFDVIHGMVFYADATAGNASGVTAWGPWIAMDDSIGRVSAIAAGIDKNGGTELFAVTTSGQIWGRSTAGPSARAALSDWTPWESFDGSLSSIAVVRYLDGRLELFGTNAAGQVFYRAQWPGSLSWSSWTQMDGSLMDVSAAINADGRVELFGVNSDDVIVERVQNSPQTDVWGPWQVIPGSLVNVSATTDAAGRIELLGTNSNGVVFHRNQTTASTDAWTDWAVFPGAVLSYTAAMRSAPAQTTGNTVGEYMFGVNNANGYMYYTYKAPGQATFGNFIQVGRVMRDIVPNINILLDNTHGCEHDGVVTAASSGNPNTGNLTIQALDDNGPCAGSGAQLFQVNASGNVVVDGTDYNAIYDYSDPTRFQLVQTNNPAACLTVGQSVTNSVAVQVVVIDPTTLQGSFQWEFESVTYTDLTGPTSCHNGAANQEFWTQ